VIGTRLGPYEITAKLGEGGMGEVYRATDSRLGREVAIKVLPESVAQDPERLARFEREAKILASLNHPNIATIHGLEESGAAPALVMELVQGPTLADRLAQGPIPLDEALPIAKQIAEGLEYAHERGIIHRDLKPANIKLTADDHVKILDFGLAKALEPDAASGGPVDLSHSPTLTYQATVQGLILGTASYMSPEQAAGKPVDKRSDIWSFGVVLYEMLSGDRLFGGETVAETMADVLRLEIDLNSLPGGIPPALRRLLRRCLERSPKNRLHDIADARIVVDDVIAGNGGSAAEANHTASTSAANGGRRALPWVIAGLALIVAFGAWFTGRSRGPASPLVVDIGAPEGERFQFQGDFGAPVVLSRDGKEIAFGAVGAESKTRLWVRSLETGEERRLDGTEGATMPFFSPDGDSLGYFVNAKLMVVPLAGGRPYEVADAPNGRGGAWAPDGTIVFAPDFRSGLFRVPASGGTATPLTTVDAKRHSTHRWPAMTPDGKAIVYLATNHAANKEKESELRWVRLDGRDDHALVPSVANGVVAGGELLYLRQQTLLARPIDDAGKLVGEARAVAPDLLFDPSTWRSAFAATADRLVFSAGGEVKGTHISRVDRTGHPLAELTSDDIYADLRLSPDGKRLAVTRGLRSDIWLLDLDRGTQSRFTFGKELENRLENSAVWSPDGRWIYFASSGDLNVSQQVVRKASNGSGEAEVDYDTKSSELGIFPLDASPDGRWLLVETGLFPFTDQADIQWLALDGSKRLVPFLNSPAVESDARLSPDGRWVAYTSNESGVDQIYVVSVSHDKAAETGAKWQLSVDGGDFPVWSRDGSEIIYLEPSLNLSRVEVTPDGAGGLRFSTPQAMFGTTLVADVASFDLAPDGQSLILNHYGEAQSRPLHMILGWKRLLAK